LFEKLSTKIELLELIPSSGGVFEVKVDGELIHSKKETGIFPNLDDLLKTLNM
jgi:selenoprotein W-related protein